MVTCRISNNKLGNDLASFESSWAKSGIKSVKVIGDAEAPAPIAWATYAGHRYARELDEIIDLHTPQFKRELVGLSQNWN